MMRRVIISTFALALFAGCAVEQEGATTPTTQGVALFSTTISKVGDTDWESGDQVGMVVTKENAIFDATTYKYNAKYNAAKGGALTPYDEETDTFYFPIDGTELNFYAYYPYSEAVNETDESYAIDTSNQSELTKLDFMEASTKDDETVYNKSHPNVALTFNRRMAKLTFNVVEGSGVSYENITSIDVEGFYTTATYSLANNSFADVGGEQSLKGYDNGDNSYSLILIPMVDSDGETITEHNEPTVVFTTNLGVDGDDVISWVLSESDIELKAGQHNIYSVRVNHVGVSVIGGINAWDDTSDPEPLDPVEK